MDRRCGGGAGLEMATWRRGAVGQRACRCRAARRDARRGEWTGFAEGEQGSRWQPGGEEQSGREPAGAGPRRATRGGVNGQALPRGSRARDGNLEERSSRAESLQVQGRATRRAEGGMDRRCEGGGGGESGQALPRGSRARDGNLEERSSRAESLQVQGRATRRAEG